MRGAFCRSELLRDRVECRVRLLIFGFRYWWVILAVTVFAMAGGGGDK